MEDKQENFIPYLQELYQQALFVQQHLDEEVKHNHLQQSQSAITKIY